MDVNGVVIIYFCLPGKLQDTRETAPNEETPMCCRVSESNPD